MISLDKYTVTIKRGTKRITLQRFLVSKIAYGKDFSLEELSALFNNQLWLQQKSKTDVNFSKKFGSDLESLTKILKESNFSRGLTQGSVTSLRRKVKSLEWDFLIPQRNFLSVESYLRNSLVIRWRNPVGVKTKDLPPEKYIGKGYRDKGTAKNPSIDASPSWQEVASSNSYLERKQNELEEIIQGNRFNNPSEKYKAVRELREVKERISKLDTYRRNRRDASASTTKRSSKK